MIDEITIRNKRTGEEIVMDKTGNTGFIISEIDWDKAKVTNESYRIPFQIGETLSGTVVGTRVPTITGYVVSLQAPELGTTWEEYYNGLKQKIEDGKDKLNRFISIYDDYEIIVGEYYLTGRPTQPIKYSYDENENNEVLCLFELEFGCYDPMFQISNGTDEKFYEVKNMFRFPIHPTSDNPLVFGIEETVTRKTIINNGDVSCGFVMTIRPLYASTSGFVLTNINTGEQFKLTYDANTDDYIVLNTLLGEEDIYIVNEESGKTQSLIPVIDIDSTFLQLQRGENELMYETNEENGRLDVDITYFERFFNIKEI